MIATTHMIVNESKSGDSLTLVTVQWHPNKWKKYNKDHTKRKITKYFRMSPDIAEELDKYAIEKKISQSMIIEKAVKKFLKIN